MYFDQKLVGKFLFHRISLRLRSGRLRQVLEERTRHLTRPTRFLGFATRRQPPELTDQSRVGRFQLGLVGWIGSGSSQTPLEQSIISNVTHTKTLLCSPQWSKHTCHCFHIQSSLRKEFCNQHIFRLSQFLRQHHPFSFLHRQRKIVTLPSQLLHTHTRG